MTDRISQLKSFIREDPSDPFNHYALAMELKNQDQSESIILLQRLINDFPDYLPTYYQLGSTLTELNRNQQAIEILNKGVLLASQQKNHKALAELRQLLSNIQDE